MSLYTHYNGKLGLICFFIYLLMLFRYRKAYYGIMPNFRNYGFILFAMVLFSLFNFGQYDTYHYAWAYKVMIEENARFGVEDFYFWLVQVLPKSYLLWRFVIWGTATLLMVLTAKKLNLNSEVFGFMVSLFFLTQFSGTRDSLGFSLMLFSAVTFIQSLDKRKILMVIVSMFGIWMSYYLHKSMFIFIAFLVLVFFLPINKKMITISLILFPFFYVIASSFSGRIISLDIFNDQQEAFINRYMGKEKAVLNTIGLITTFFEKSSLVLFMLIIVKRMFYDKIISSKEHLFVFKYAYLMIYISFLFLGQDISIWISSRALHAGMFALVLCAGHCFNLYNTDRRTILEKIAFFFMLIPTFWDQVSFILKNW